MVGGALHAGSAPREFSVPAGPAIETLKMAALQGEVEVLIAVNVPPDVVTKPVRGRWTAREALDEMLAGSPLIAVPVSDGRAFGILFRRSTAAVGAPTPAGTSTTNPNREPESRMPSPKSSRLSATAQAVLAFFTASTAPLSGQQPPPEAIVLSPFEVKTSAESSLWSVNQSSGGTRVAVPLKELPFSLDVLTTEFMDDFIVSDLGEVLAHIGNVSGLESYTGAGSGNSIRGFSQYYQLRNGFYRNGVIDKTLVSRVEVVKGPYSAIYGRGEPGGVINYISKRPVLGRRSGSVIAEIGENNTARVQLEQTLSLSKNTGLLLAGSYLERNFDQMFARERTRNFGAVLRQRLLPGTEVVLEYEHMFRRNNRGRPVIDTRIDGRDPADGSNNKYTGEFAVDFMARYGWVNTLGPTTYSDRVLDTVNVTLTHQFAPGLHLRVAFNDSRTKQDYDYTAFGSSTIFINPTTRAFTRWDTVPAPFWRQLPSDVRNVQADLTADFTTGKIKHSALITFDHSRQEDRQISERAANGGAANVYTVAYAPGRIPNYTNDAGALHGPRSDPLPRFNPAISYRATPEYYTWLQQNTALNYDIDGVFVMDRVRLFDGKVLVMAGGRYDQARTTITERLSPDKKTVTGRTESKVDDLTYNVGLNYNLSSETVLFASHSTSFNPKGNVYSHTGKPMPNERGEGYELGFRAKLPGNRVDLGASYFHIERQNIRIQNPAFDPLVDSPSLKPEFVAGGLDRSKGFEVYANGKVSDELSARLSLGTADAKHIKSLDGWRQGLPLVRTPEWNYSVGASYARRSGLLKGFNLSAAYRAQSGYRLQDRAPTAADRRGALRAEAGGNLDLAAGYRWKSGDRFRQVVRVALKNALDDVFIEGSGYYSLGRQVTASFTLEY
jgi:iron complex outermembrane recepter protein